MNHNVSVSFGGFAPMLTIAFIVLKLCGQIDWSWLWVLSPLWISAGLCLVCIVIYALLSSIKSR